MKHLGLSLLFLLACGSKSAPPPSNTGGGPAADAGVVPTDDTGHDQAGKERQPAGTD